MMNTCPGFGPASAALPAGTRGAEPAGTARSANAPASIRRKIRKTFIESLPPAPARPAIIGHL